MSCHSRRIYKDEGSLFEDTSTFECSLVEGKYGLGHLDE